MVVTFVEAPMAGDCILITGVTGFVGQLLCERLLIDGLSVRGAARQQSFSVGHGYDRIVVGNIDGATNWSAALVGVRVVVHLAARVHVRRESVDDPLGEFRQVNVDGTLNLARQAADAGVSRLVFLSSVKVNGEMTHSGRPFTEDAIPNPRDPYGVSKYEAELGLANIAENSDMEVTIIRPPLVYGPGVKANFASMMYLVGKGIPLPFGAICHNFRSLVGLDNLVDFISLCISHPAAANQTFLVSDGEDLSTAELLRRVGFALGRPARLVWVPLVLLRVGALALGKHAIAQRLCTSLQVDIKKGRKLLGWKPPISVDEGLRRVTLSLVL